MKGNGLLPDEPPRMQFPGDPIENPDQPNTTEKPMEEQECLL